MTLIFVYNAKSGSLNRFFDAAHKLLSPETYSCHLCNLTHNTLSERKSWRAFRSSTEINMEFYHIDEFEDRFKLKWSGYPVILKKEEDGLFELIPRPRILAFQTPEELISEIKTQVL